MTALHSLNMQGLPASRFDAEDLADQGPISGSMAADVQALASGAGLDGSERLTTAQFTRHLAHVEDEAMRAALGRYVGEVSAVEVVTMVRNLARMKARYVAVALAAGTNTHPPSLEDAQELQAMRLRIDALEQGLATVKESIAQDMVPVADITPTKRRRH